ncbi:MAG: hypothetical protein GY895_05225 [Phycisphaera sp.]|nr:hypothetical protein [Phycisphaera sp.]
MKGGHLIGVAFLAASGWASSAEGGDVPAFGPDLEIVPTGIAGYDGFGLAVDWIDDSRVVVGAPGDDSGGDEAGAVWILDLDLDQQPPILASASRILGSVIDAQFGESVMGFNGYLVVGSPLESDRRGAVRIVADDGNWSETHIEVGETPEGRLGACLAGAGTTLAIGAPGGNEPSVLLLEWLDGDVVASASLASPDIDDRFGVAISVSANGQVAVGAPGFDGDRGRVHVFMRGKKGWMASDVISGLQPGDRFGEALSFCGDRLAIGAPGTGSGDVGEVFLLEPDFEIASGSTLGSQGFETGNRLAFDPASGLLGVGCTGSNYSGGVRLHRIDETVDPLVDLVPMPGPADFELLGRGLAIRDGFVFTGSPFRTGTSGIYAGSCFLAGTGLDCDLDGVEDAWEIASGMDADCNQNGIIDACDLAADSSEDRDGNGIPDECQEIVVLEVPLPFPTINDALDVARDGDRILVGPGTYFESVDFDGRAIEIVSSGGAEVTMLDGTGLLDGSVVVAMNAETPASILQGFTITNGVIGTVFPLDPSVRVGGGLFAYFASPTITDCILTGNNAAFGGGAYLYQWGGTLSGCDFIGNDAAADGGGLQLSRCDGLVTGILVSDNTAIRRGGGMHVFNGSPTIELANVTGNRAVSEGGGVSFASFDGTPRLVDSLISKNQADILGGGVFIDGDTRDPEISGTSICDNAPDDVYGSWTDQGGNTICFCDGDLNLDGEVSASDLGLLLANWANGPNFPRGDLNGDGEIGPADLGLLLSLFGPCL